MGNARCVMECFLQFFNFLILVTGMVVISVGVLAHLKVEEFMIVSEVCSEHIPVFAMVVGCVITLIALFGSYGGYRENTLVLAVHSILMLVLMVGTALLAVVIFMKSSSFLTDVDFVLRERFFNNLEEFSKIEKQFNCCGPQNSLSYELKGLNLSETCCPTPPCSLSPEKVYPGCIGKIVPILETASWIMGGTTAIIGLVQIVDAVLSACLAIKINKHYEKV